MMIVKNWLKILLLLGAAVGVQETRAAVLVNVTAQNYPGEEYEVGVDLDAQNTILDFYYKNEKGVVTPYSIKTIESDEGAVLRKKAGRNVIILRGTVDVEHKTGTLTFDYLVNGLRGNRDSVTGNLDFNVNTAQYEITDPETNKPVTSAYIISKFLFNREVGIKSIELR